MGGSRFLCADSIFRKGFGDAHLPQGAGQGGGFGGIAQALALARTLGQVWQASPTAGLYAITADADFEAHFGKKAAKRRKIYNGMIPCQIYMYFDRPVKPVRK